MRYCRKKSLNLVGIAKQLFIEKNLKINLGEKFCIFSPTGPAQCPRCLRCRSAAARLLGMQVRIPPGHGSLSLVNVVCFQVEVSVTGRTLLQRTATDGGVSECDHESSTMRRPWPNTVDEPWTKKIFHWLCYKHDNISVNLHVKIHRLISFTNFNAQFLYSLAICMLHYNPQRISSINMPIFRRTNCIITASVISHSL